MATTTPSRFKAVRLGSAQANDPKVLKARLDEASGAAQLRDAVLAERDAQIARSEKDLATAARQTETLRATVAARDTAGKGAATQIAELSNQNRVLKAQLDKLTVNRPKIAVDELVRQFSSGIEKLNIEARKAGGTAFLVDNLEVEIKAGIDVSDGLRLSQLPDSALGVESASTLRFALKQAAVIRMVDDEEVLRPTPQ